MDLKIVVLFSFLAACFLATGLGQLLLARKRALAERLRELTGKQAAVVRAGAGPDAGKVSFKALLAGTGRFSPRVLALAAEKRLGEADLPLKGEEFVALSIFCAGGGCLLAAVCAARPLLAVPAGLIAGLAPWLFLETVKGRRIARFNGQLADTLSIMTNSLRAGFSFLQAMEVVQREMPPPAGREFGRAFRELSLGVPVEEVLTGLAQRLKSEDLSLVVTAVLIQRQVGGSLAEVLEKIAQTIRERVRIQGEIRSLTAQGRISGSIVGFLPVFLVILMMMINPEYMLPLFTLPAGRAMLGGAVLAELLGWFFIRRIINIQV